MATFLEISSNIDLSALKEFLRTFCSSSNIVLVPTWCGSILSLSCSHTTRNFMRLFQLFPYASILISRQHLNLFFYLYRKTEEQKPKEQRPKASENKPVMNE